MPKRLIDLRDARPILDIASYARRGPSHRDRLSPAEVESISRTVTRTPEVMAVLNALPHSVSIYARDGRDVLICVCTMYEQACKAADALRSSFNKFAGA